MSNPNIDILIFNRHLAALLKTGHTLSESLRLLIEQSPPALAPVLAAGYKGLQAGQSFSESLAPFSGYFPPAYLSLLQAGERNQLLEPLLSSCSAILQLDYMIQNKLRSYTLYTQFILAVTPIAGIVTLLLMCHTGQQFQNMGSALPAFSQGFFTLITHPLTMIVLALVVLSPWWVWLGFRRLSQTRKDAWLLNMPFWGTMQRIRHFSGFFSSTALLLQAQIPLTQALKEATHMLHNSLLQSHLCHTIQAVEQGEVFSVALRQQHILPEVTLSQIANAETTGQLPDALYHIAQQYKEQLEWYSESNVPFQLLMLAGFVVVGCLICLMLIATYLPMFSLIGAIR